MSIYLASQSPRRQALLRQIGVDFKTVDVVIDETWDSREAPENYTHRIALEKARAAKSNIRHRAPILAADTAVVIDDVILGKAETKTDAITMLNRLSGRTHTVLSAVALIAEEEQSRLNISRVTFRELPEDEVLHYSETDEPIGKAGGYAIQGKAAVFIERLEGSYSAVMGLPLFETWQLLHSIQHVNKRPG